MLEIARTFAGYSLGQADVMRKAMGKKIPAVMIAERKSFVDGAVGKGYDKALAESIFGLIEPFAGYAFNKAHAFSYATLSWRTTYLKAHYPVEFMTAVLQCSGHDRHAAALAECAATGIAVLPPDINRSAENFAIERVISSDDEIGGAGDAAIRFGLAQIKNVGHGAVTELIAERRSEGEFGSLERFARRIPRSCNKRVLESLAKAGALDSLVGGHEQRASVVGGVGRVMAVAQEAQHQRETGQTSMFDLLGDEVATPLPALEIEKIEAPDREMLEWERELLGACVSGHPFREAARALAEYVSHGTAELDSSLVGTDVVIAGAVTAVRKLMTKKGAEFAAVTIEDLGGTTEITIWPDTWERQGAALTAGTVTLLKAAVRERGERLSLAVQSMVVWDEASGEFSGPPPTVSCSARGAAATSCPTTRGRRF